MKSAFIARARGGVKNSSALFSGIWAFLRSPSAFMNFSVGPKRPHAHKLTSWRRPCTFQWGTLGLRNICPRTGPWRLSCSGSWAACAGTAPGRTAPAPNSENVLAAAFVPEGPTTRTHYGREWRKLHIYEGKYGRLYTNLNNIYIFKLASTHKKCCKILIGMRWDNLFWNLMGCYGI